jgi:hypothetical protein
MEIKFTMTQQEIDALNDVVDYVLLDARDNQFYHAQARVLQKWIMEGGVANES